MTADNVVKIESRHRVECPREALWTVLRMTDWINRSLGLPAVAYRTEPRPEGGSRVFASARFLGQALEWEEMPWDWHEPEFYQVRRVFSAGPFIEGVVGVRLESAGTDATDVVAFSNLLPRGIAGRIMAQTVIAGKTNRDMRELLAHVKQHLGGRMRVPLPNLPRHAPDETALGARLDSLKTRFLPPEVLQRLGEFLREAPDVEVVHIRPWALARRWGLDRWDVLRVFLHATRVGLLDLSWEVLCPNCRSSRTGPAGSLFEVGRENHCDACQVRFDAEFDRSVELKFAVSPAIRLREDLTFCLVGPGGRPHVVSQFNVAPGQSVTRPMPILDKPLRIRSPQVKASTTLTREDLGAAPVSMRLEPARDAFAWAPTPGDQAASGPVVAVHNPNPHPVQVVFERLHWSDDILTAAQVTNWQEFRDLFAEEILSPHEQVVVGEQVVLFTDLRGSTAMYRELGDPRAYARVREHFQILMRAIRSGHGAVVKTIGDAVMAVYSRVDEALASVGQMHAELAAAQQGVPPEEVLRLKTSLHAGPCLAVNANDKLDYFGSTVNLAARMVDKSQGGDLIVSDGLYQRPETAPFLARLAIPAERSEVQFRGFETPHVVWRLRLLAS